MKCKENIGNFQDNTFKITLNSIYMNKHFFSDELCVFVKKWCWNFTGFQKEIEIIKKGRPG